MRRPAVLQRKGQSEIAMTPMIDVVFLLLVFFLWTASFQVVEQILPSQMTEQSSAGVADSSDPPPEEDFENVVVRIRWQGNRPSWTVNELTIASLAALRDRLNTIAAVKTDAPVILDPDREVPVGYVMDAYDVSRLAGFEQVQFAVSEES